MLSLGLDSWKFAIIYKPVAKCVDKARRISSILRSKGLSIKLYSVDDALKEESIKSDILISVGGDGTLLRISRIYHSHTPLVLPIPCGRRTAFYEDIKPENYEEVVEKVLRGEFTIELLIRIKLITKKAEYAVLNEGMIISKNRGRVTGFKIEVTTPYIKATYGFEGDGVLIGPSPGSAAYNLSAKGSLLTGDLYGIFITPLNPMDLVITPLIIPLLSRVIVSSRGYTELYIDGEKAEDLKPYSKVLIEFGGGSVRLIRLGKKREYIRDIYEKRRFRSR